MAARLRISRKPQLDSNHCYAIGLLLGFLWAQEDMVLVQNQGNMWLLVAAVLAFTYAPSDAAGQSGAVGDVVNAMGFSWPEKHHDLKTVEIASTEEATDAVAFEDDASAASKLYMTDQGQKIVHTNGNGEAGSAGWGLVDTAGAALADTDTSYMNTHVLHAPVEAMTVVSENGRHSETSGKTMFTSYFVKL